MTRYKPTLFKKVVSLLAAAAIMITFMPKLDFGIEAHAEYVISYTDTDATSGTGTVTIAKGTPLTLLTREVFNRTAEELNGSGYGYGYDFAIGSPTTASFQLSPGYYYNTPDHLDDSVTFSSEFAGDYVLIGKIIDWDTSTEPAYTRTLTIHVVDPFARSVSFEENGGSTVDDKTGITNGATITAPTAPTRDGFEFVGWYKEPALTNAWVFGTDTVTANITLYAKWNQTDFTAPSAPTGLDMYNIQDTGSSNSDNITRNSSVTITGFAEPKSNVTLYDTDGATVLAQTTADSFSGIWTVGITLSEGVHNLTAKATDNAGNTSDASSQLQITIDKTNPVAPVITEIADDTGESSSDLITKDCDLTISGTAEPFAKVNVYKAITESTNQLLGTVDADASGNWSFDFFGNSTGVSDYTILALQIDVAGNTGLSSSVPFKIDAEAPSVSGVNIPVSAIYPQGALLEIDVAFNEEVNITGTPRLELNISGVVKYANYGGKFPDGRLRFFYSVVNGDNDSDGIAITGLSLNGGTITDIAGNPANLTLNNMASTAGIKIDSTKPTVNSFIYPTTKTYIYNDTMLFSLAFNENVTVNTVGGTPYLKLTIAGVDFQAVMTSVAGNTLNFKLDVPAGYVDTDGIDIDNKITLNGATIKDAAGNDATLTYTFGGHYPNVKVDSKPPVVMGVSHGDTPTSAVTISFDEGTATISRNLAPAIPFANNSTISEDGMYTLTVTDAYGNATYVTFIVSIPNYTVNFTTPEGATTVASQTIQAGMKATQPTDPTLEGNNFDGWFNGETQWNFENEIVSNLELIAKFSLKQFTVKYYVDGIEEPISTQILSFGAHTAALSAVPPIGHDFVGWYNGDVLWNRLTDEVKSDLNLVARFQVKTYNINFETNTDEVADFSTTADFGTKLTAPTAPTKMGYDFLGWYNGETKWNFAENTVASNLTLAAKYKLHTYNISYETNSDDTADFSATADFNTKLTEPTAPTKTGYDFDGWYVGDDKWNFENAVTSDLTLSAKYNIHTYNISFETNTDEVADFSTTADYGTKLTAPTAPTKTGHNFLGWYNGDTEWNFDTDTVKSDVTLTQKFAPKMYRVVFSLNDGVSNNSADDTEYNSLVQNPGDPTRDGHIFLGWYSGGHKWDFANDRVTEEIMLTARWEAKKIEIVQAPPELINPAAPPTVSAPSTAFDTSVEVRIVKQPEFEQQLRGEFKAFLGNGNGNFDILPLSITLYQTGTDKVVQPKDGAPVTFTVPVPIEMLKYKDKLCVYYNDNGEWVALDTNISYRNNTMVATFTTHHFSPYALVVDKDGVLENFNDRNNTPAKPTDNPNTSGKTPDIMLALIGLSALVIGRKLKLALKSK